MIWENMKLALKSMIANKMRSILSLLGIVIGVSSVVAILTLGESATGSITDSISSGGMDIVTIYPSPNQKSADTFDELFCDTIKNNIQGIDEVLPVNSSQTRIRNGQEILSATIAGVQSNYAENLSYETESGEWFSKEDNIYKRQVVVLGSEIAEELFPAGDAVGNYVSIFRNQSKRYLVVAVMEEKDSTLSLSFNNTIYVPYNTYVQRFTRVQTVGSYVAKVSDGEDPIKAGDDLTEFLDNLVGSDSYSLFSPATLAEMAEEITGTLSLFLAAIGGISLLVGGIGIMNIMLVSVAERTKEIGIRKALGASPSVIRGQFITEAITLTLIGGLLGIILGTLISRVVTNIAGWSFHISVSSYLISAGFSMVIGVFFGWYPAHKAAKLDPIESLNYE